LPTGRALANLVAGALLLSVVPSGMVLRLAIAGKKPPRYFLWVA
jgi:hypothetical protein